MAELRSHMPWGHGQKVYIIKFKKIIKNLKMSKNICKTNKADHGKCRKRDLTECKKLGKTKQLWLRKSGKAISETEKC